MQEGMTTTVILQDTDNAQITRRRFDRFDILYLTVSTGNQTAIVEIFSKTGVLDHIQATQPEEEL
jgi:hypothetical protein